MHHHKRDGNGKIAAVDLEQIDEIKETSSHSMNSPNAIEEK